MLKRLENAKLPRVPFVPQKLVGPLIFLALALLIAVLVAAAWGGSFPLFQTRGEIATRQRNLLLFASALALLVLLPVYYMLFTFAWRYRAGHRKEYKPDWDSNRLYEAIWWTVPVVIIVVLGAFTWVTSHSLDPYKPLASSKEPLKVQVIAMEWKWLFLYPDQNVASINEVVFPAERPVEFTITSDGPMNSFWIPQLAGQIYAMSGMSTKLNIAADKPGTYKGLSSNISGAGFADMKFDAVAVSEARFKQWVAGARTASRSLDAQSYAQLRQKSVKDPVRYYKNPDTGLYDQVVKEYAHGAVARPVQVKSPEEKNASQVKNDKISHDMHMMEGMQ